ncbi:hypothetical protein AAFC00_000546 [Neodothiora populina]|uniref:Domain of unknown function at the cortex 1 domain-containing protein n=1 Tax=Neodothiora populina TaxID=2781224 RepID=A0ABR3PDM9_9PEZI
MADRYILKATAGPDYDEANQKVIAVNSETPFTISSSKIDADVTIRVQKYHGLPKGSPETSPYFDKDPHKSDLYSLAFNFRLKEHVNGNDLVFGNDFDHPIRDKLPPGFSQALKIVQWFIDPGLYGDAYADEPYLYGPFLSSINTFRVGAKDAGAAQHSSTGEPVIITEGADGDGAESRAESKIPDDAAARKKWFLNKDHLSNFKFDKGRTYSADFFNPYLDFNEFALKLPGFSLVPGITIPIISYWDGQPLRYVLKNRATDEVLFVVIFTLIPKDQADKIEDGDKKTVPQADEAEKEKDGKASSSSEAGGNDDLD